MIGDDELMALADGELDAEATARLEMALEADPELRARFERQRHVRTLMAASFDPVLDEPVPSALSDAVARSRSATEPKAGTLVDLAAMRAARAAAAAQRPTPARPHRAWGYGLAAAGVAALALIMLRPVGLPGAPAPSAGLVKLAAGDMTAAGPLARGLDRDLASTPDPKGRIHVGLTFRDHNRHWCRTFTAAPDRLAGLACREGGAWRVEVLQSVSPPSGGEGFRVAASGAPAAVQATVDQSIVGDAADATAERRARDSGWR